MAEIRIRKLRDSILGAIVLALLLSQRGLGFMFVLPVIFLLPWLLYSGYVIAFKAERRLDQIARMSVWLVCISVVIAVHTFWAHKTRSNADEVVQLINDYAKIKGRCAKNLEELGMTKDQLRSKVGISYYYCDENSKPHFFYAGTFVMFDKNIYNFDNGYWEYKPD